MSQKHEARCIWFPCTCKSIRAQREINQSRGWEIFGWILSAALVVFLILLPRELNQRTSILMSQKPKFQSRIHQPIGTKSYTRHPSVASK